MFNTVLTRLNIVSFCRVQLLLPVLFLFYRENGINAGDFFLFQAIFTMSKVLLEIPIGYISDYFSKKNILIFSFLLLMIRAVLWIFFKGYWIVMIGEIINAISTSMYIASSSSYIYEYLSFISTKKRKNMLMLKKYSVNNFFNSISIAVVALLGSMIYAKFGCAVSMLIELIAVSVATVILITIPKINNFKQNNDNISKKYNELVNIIKETIFNKNYNKYIMYSTLFSTTTLLLSNNFQPLMKFSELPLCLFGVIYFINYILRAMSGIFAPVLIRYINLQKITNITAYCFTASTLLFFLSYIINNKILTFLSIILACIAIFLEVVYCYVKTTKIHSKTDNNIRTTVMSVTTVLPKCSTAIFLFLFKIFSDTISVKYLLLIYSIIFLTVFNLIKKNKNEYKF